MGLTPPVTKKNLFGVGKGTARDIELPLDPEAVGFGDRGEIGAGIRGDEADERVRPFAAVIIRNDVA